MAARGGSGSRGGASGPIHPLDKSLNRRQEEASLSAFGFLFAEMVRYYQNRITNLDDLERKLENAGKSVGFKFLELVAHRDRPGRRETKLIGALQFVSSTCFKALFGRVADALEKSTENADEYMISDHDPVTNRFISVPRDMGKINCAAYIAGIIEGILAGQGFPARVTAHSVEMPDGAPDKTVYLIKFDRAVMEREMGS